MWVVSTTLVLGERDQLLGALAGSSEALGSASSYRMWTSLPTRGHARLEPFRVTSLWATQGCANSKTAFPAPPLLHQ